MWIAITQEADGTLREHQGNVSDWRSVRRKLVGLAFEWNGKRHDLPPGMKEYFQATSASAAIGGGPIKVESRYIGCRDKAGKIMRLRFYEGQDEPTVEIEHPCQTPSI
jgi:hypothetical protein